MRRGRRPPGADVVVWAPFAGALYGVPRSAGGAELQAFTLARSLAAAGLRVRHVLGDRGGSARDGVEIVELSDGYRRRGLPRRLAILEALREADGRVYVQRSAGIETGFVGLYTRATGRRSIFSASSDGDFARDRAQMSLMGGSLEEWPVRMQYRVGLRTVHDVVAQTHQQAEVARRNFGLAPQVIPSFCTPVGRADAAPEAVLWIGSLTEVKDPRSYVALAERLPDVPFRMVAHDHPSGWKELAAEVRGRGAALDNLEILPTCPREELFKLYERAIAVVNTSWFEGFPNTFLEGWTRAIPAVSLRIDPDGAIVRHGSGVFADGSLDVAAEAIRRYHEEPPSARAAGDAGLAYIEETHAPAVVTPKWVALVERLAGPRGR